MGPQCDGGFFKSSYSASTSTCLEVAFVEGVDGVDGVAAVVRSSKQADGPTLVFSRAEWEAFELGVFNGEFSMPV